MASPLSHLLCPLLLLVLLKNATRGISLVVLLSALMFVMILFA